jgi:disulfide oxidoreductase YuzD
MLRSDWLVIRAPPLDQVDDLLGTVALLHHWGLVVVNCQIDHSHRPPLGRYLGDALAPPAEVDTDQDVLARGVHLLLVGAACGCGCAIVAPFSRATSLWPQAFVNRHPSVLIMLLAAPASATFSTAPVNKKYQKWIRIKFCDSKIDNPRAKNTESSLKPEIPNMAAKTKN